MTKENSSEEAAFHYGQLLLPEASMSKDESITLHIYFLLFSDMPALPESDSPSDESSTEVLIQFTEEIARHLPYIWITGRAQSL